MVHKSHRKIHKKLRQHTPEGVRKAKKLFSFKYPKLLILIALIVLSYYLFSQPFAVEWIESFNNLGHFGIFIAGLLTGLGFTAPFGFALLIKVVPSNIFIASVVAGAGATIADLLIFRTIKLSFMDEFKKLEKMKVIKQIEKIVEKKRPVLIRHYALYIFAGIVLATPLPDELGVSMLAGLTTIKPINLAVIGLLLHSATAFLVLSYI